MLKVLDEQGRGRISDVIAALDYVVANKDALNIRIVNLSVATGVYESYNTDPLTLAAKRAVDAGIVVVAAAGNNGRSPQGATQYGGITAPGNAPWVLTVGASSHMGTIDRNGRHDRGIQLARADARSTRRQAGPRRARRRHRIAQRSRQRLYATRACPPQRHSADVVSVRT